VDHIVRQGVAAQRARIHSRFWSRRMRWECRWRSRREDRRYRAASQLRTAAEPRPRRRRSCVWMAQGRRVRLFGAQ
ncbi:hypothetical protein AAVH_42281, partial [Aphelenchoides avenae]